REARRSGDRRCRRACLGLVAQRELVELLAVELGEAGGELLAALRTENDLDRPVFARLEGLDLGFALADQPQRHRLDATGRLAARQLAPQHRRQGEADKIIEGTAGEIGLDQLAIDLAPM